MFYTITRRYIMCTAQQLSKDKGDTARMATSKPLHIRWWVVTNDSILLFGRVAHNIPWKKFIFADLRPYITWQKA